MSWDQKFTLDGRDHMATFDTTTTCSGMPAPQTAVTASVDPANPSDAMIVDLDSESRNMPLFFDFMGAMGLGVTGMFLGLAYFSIAVPAPWRTRAGGCS